MAFLKNNLKIRKIMGSYDSNINFFPDDINNLKIKNKLNKFLKICAYDWLVNLIIF